MTKDNNCTYKTPCGWCSKWDKKCDELMYTKAYRMKHPKGISAKPVCESESDHNWECVSTSTESSFWICNRCGARLNLTHVL